MKQTELVHVHRAMKDLKEVREGYPELFNDDNDFHFVVAWEIVNRMLLEQYKDE